MFDLGELPPAAAIIDFGLVLAGLVYVLAARDSWPKEPRKQVQSERSMGATTAGSFITVGVAASSILLASVGVLLGLGTDKEPLASEVFTQLTVAALCLVGSLVFGVVAAAYVLSHVHNETSVAENATVITAATAQLVALAAGCVCLVIALFLL